jgi:hypothetical protein
MRAELKALHSPDVQDLENWQPTDPERFGFLLQAMIGPFCGQGMESFDIQVCTPAWFGQNMLSDVDLRTGEHIIFMSRYDYRALVGFIERYCHRCEGETWRDVAQRLGRLGRWEFEDYRLR